MRHPGRGDRIRLLDSVFAIFSTTKALTGTLAMQLVEEGRLAHGLYAAFVEFETTVYR